MKLRSAIVTALVCAAATAAYSTTFHHTKVAVVGSVSQPICCDPTPVCVPDQPCD